MAYIGQDRKAKIAAQLKAIMPAGWKYSLAILNHSTIVLTISAAPVDLCAIAVAKWNERRAAQHNPMVETDHIQLNHYYPENYFDGGLLQNFRSIIAALNIDNFDHSDIMTDYHCVGHYVSINIGKWHKPFVCTIKPEVQS